MATITDQDNMLGGRPRRRRRWRVLMWIGIVFLFAIATLYARLLAGPLPLPFVSASAQQLVLSSLPAKYGLELGETGLALEGLFVPVIQFSPVRLTDSESGATIEMSALEIGFSPVRALIGQPGASVTMVNPRFQIIQDLFGPRLATFELIEGARPEDAMIRIINGDQSLPPVKISEHGIAVQGAIPEGSGAQFRSDNDWLVTNMKATEEGLRGFAEQSDSGRFAKLIIKNGTLEMHDAVYGIFREFTNISLDMAPRGENMIEGRFSADLAGETTTGTLQRSVAANGNARLNIRADNLDFASFAPFIDDPDGMMAIKGGGDLGLDIQFTDEDTQIASGTIDVDLTGTQLRVGDDYFPVATRNVVIAWQPDIARFDLKDAAITIGKSHANLSGLFVLGLDNKYGPTVSMSIDAKDVALQPEDMAAPDAPFSQIVMSGWSAPLYGALGIDGLTATKGDAVLNANGRIDMLRKGMGIDLWVAGKGSSADDLKRLWPYFVSTTARDWFVNNVGSGKIADGSMRVNLPVGSIAVGGEDKPVPQGGLSIDLTGDGVSFTPVPGMEPVNVAGKSHVQVIDNQTTVRLDGAVITNKKGDVNIGNAAFIIDSEANNSSVFELSGDISGTIRSIIELTRERAPGSIENADLPIDPDTLRGEISGQVVATIVLDAKSEIESLDYAANGQVSNFSSTEPIQSYSFDGGEMTFRVSPADFRLAGTANVAGQPADLVLEGPVGGEIDTVVSATLSAEGLKKLGFDATTFLGGDVKFAARLSQSGTTQITADLKDASLDVTDLGISKAKGVDGTLNAEITQDGTRIDAKMVDLAFGDVKLVGEVSADSEKGLISADFSQFAISEGDDSQLSLAPIDGGISIKLRGNQLDIKPMLKRFFAIDQVSTGGPQATQFKQTIAVDANLKRAVGYYKTTAYNLDLNMRLKGEDLQSVSMQGQFADNNSVSITTNQVPGGHVLSVAFNDAGTLLRFLNVYSRLAGGAGSIVMTTNVAEKTDTGDVRMTDFQLVDEANVAQVLGNHSDSKALIAKENRIAFNSGKLSFIRRPDRVEVTEAILDGNSVGGTLRGFVYTKERRYDLTGTYVPLFGLNSIFQKLPIIGQVIGGRDGEGLMGVTFAIRGDLDKPEFLINPASLLVPGAFRGLFEYHAKEAPREPVTPPKN